MVIVLGLTGLAAAGKSTVSEHLKEQGFRHIIFSHILKQEAKKRGVFKEGMSLEEEKSALLDFGMQWRKETGRNDIIAVRIIEMIKEDGAEKVMVDGFRTPAEVNLFRENFEKFYLIFVGAEENTRFERRKREDPDTDFESFAARDRKDIETKGLDKVIEMADILVDNNGTREELAERIDNLMKKLP